MPTVSGIISGRKTQVVITPEPAPTSSITRKPEGKADEGGGGEADRGGGGMTITHGRLPITSITSTADML